MNYFESEHLIALWHNENNTASELGVTAPSNTSANSQLCKNGQVTYPCLGPLFTK